MTDGAFEEICNYVEADLGFATSHYNDSYLNRRISSRMRRRNSDSFEAYLETLQSESEEQEALLDSLSINVTGFFRNPDVWSGIRSVLKELSDSNDSIHIWSAACADGREPYSLSMLVHADPRIDESSVYILGTDISESALETARSGVYSQSRTTDIGEQLEILGNHERFVTERDGAFHISEAIKEHVSFERHDLINDEPKSGFDLVVCRNLFIYIDNDYKESMLGTIANSLQTGGFLVIGKAETIPPQLKSAFSVHDGRLRIYQLEESDSRTRQTQ